MQKMISEINKTISDTTNSLVFSKDEEPDRNVSKVITIGWRDVLPDPPANNSDVTMKELKMLQDITKNRTKEQTDLVILVDESVANLFIPFLEENNLHFPRKMIDTLWDNVMYPVIMNLKWRYNRPRPYQLGFRYGFDIDHIQTETHNTPAYPSGHTAYGAMLASVLSDIYPEYSSDFYKLANVAGRARELQGVHYPSDNNAAMVIVSALWEDVRYDFL